MSKADDRRAAQDAAALDDLIAMNERRPVEPVVAAVTDRRSWASSCAGWRVGIHERTREHRLAGIYKCKWCGQSFDPPTEADLKTMRDRAVQYSRAPHIRRGKW